MTTKKIDGMVFNLKATHKTKPMAKEHAKNIRRYNKYVRLIKSTHGTWLIYARKR